MWLLKKVTQYGLNSTDCLPDSNTTQRLPVWNLHHSEPSSSSSSSSQKIHQFTRTRRLCPDTAELWQSYVSRAERWKLLKTELLDQNDNLRRSAWLFLCPTYWLCSDIVDCSSVSCVWLTHSTVLIGGSCTHLSHLGNHDNSTKGLTEQLPQQLLPVKLAVSTHLTVDQ